jgi:NAD(P)-dependent dehydrogenase (short-subunit alcohol dehydrogenase family)
MSERDVALVLGCSVGTGNAIAHKLAVSTGLDIIGIHRGNHMAEADALQMRISDTKRDVHLLRANAGDLDAIPSLVDRIGEILGPRRLRIAVHSCASASIGLVVNPVGGPTLHPKQLHKTFDVMAHSFLVWGQELMKRRLLAEGGSILALLNSTDQNPVRGCCAIGAAKAALAAYVLYMAAELGPLGVQVNGLRFGTTKTHALEVLPGAAHILDAVRSFHPRGRLTSVDDVADFVSLLAQPNATWLNGSIIDFDGGERLNFCQYAVNGTR